MVCMARTARLHKFHHKPGLSMRLRRAALLQRNLFLRVLACCTVTVSAAITLLRGQNY